MAESYNVTCFYVGAELYFDLDDVTVDALLEEHGLKLTDDTLAECRDVIKSEYPERWAHAKRLMRSAEAAMQ